MTNRHLYIAAYDVTDAKRLRQILQLLRDYSNSYQKSVFECRLTISDKKKLLEKVEELLDKDNDRFFLFKCHSQHQAHYLGYQEKVDEDCFIIN